MHQEQFLYDLVADIWQSEPDAQYTQEELADKVGELFQNPEKTIKKMEVRKMIVFNEETSPPTFTLSRLIKKELLKNV